jgi:hypothetical protein
VKRPSPAVKKKAPGIGARAAGWLLDRRTFNLADFGADLGEYLIGYLDVNRQVDVGVAEVRALLTNEVRAYSVLSEHGADLSHNVFV